MPIWTYPRSHNSSKNIPWGLFCGQNESFVQGGMLIATIAWAQSHLALEVNLINATHREAVIQIPFSLIQDENPYKLNHHFWWLQARMRPASFKSLALQPTAWAIVLRVLQGSHWSTVDEIWRWHSSRYINQYNQKKGAGFLQQLHLTDPV